MKDEAGKTGKLGYVSLVAGLAAAAVIIFLTISLLTPLYNAEEASVAVGETAPRRDA